MQYRRSVQGRMLLTELETCARTESKRMTNHNTPHLSRMGKPVHCATFHGLSRLNTRAIHCHRAISFNGRARAQMVSPRLLISAAWFRARIRANVGFVVEEVALGQVFSEYLGFSCQFEFQLLLHIHHLSSGAGTTDQTSDLRTKWTQSHAMRKINKIIINKILSSICILNSGGGDFFRFSGGKKDSKSSWFSSVPLTIAGIVPLK
jgi:hypothetical protein